MGNDQNQQDPFAQATQPDLPVTRDRSERILGMGVTPGSSLEKALQQHHAERAAQAEMYRKVAADALGTLHYGKNPQTGEDLNPDDIAKLTQQKDYAVQQYGKLVGVNKEAKGALEKAHGIIDFITGAKQRQAQMAAPPTPQYGTNVSDAGVSTSSPVGPPPTAGPTPQYASNVSDAGVTYDPRKAMTPPPQSPKDAARQAAYQQKLSALESSITAPYNQQGVRFNTGLEQEGRKTISEVQTRQGLVKKVIPEADQNKPYVQDYMLTGNISRGMAAQFKMQRGPLVMDEFGIPHATFVNPDTSIGGIVDSINMQPITKGTPISQSDLSAHQIFYEGPGGEKLFGYTFGTGENKKLYDQGFQELPAGTKGWSAADVVKTTKGSAERIDPVTGERQILHTTRTIGPQNKVAPAVTAPAVQGPPSPNSTPLPPAGTKITGPGGYKAGTQQAPAANKPSSSPTGKLSGPTGVVADQDARREEAYQKKTNLKNLTSSTRTMIEAAPKVNNFIARIEPQIDALQDELGPSAGRWNEFWTGKVGTKNPEYMKLRTDVGLLETLLMKMHVGARGSDMIMQHFKDLIAQGKQDPDNMRAALEEIKAYADSTIQEGKDAGVDPTAPVVRGRNAMPSPPSPTSSGQRVTLDQFLKEK